MVEQPAVLITDAVHPLLLEGLQQAGYYCVYQPDIAASVVLNTIKDYVGIVINSKILVDKKGFWFIDLPMVTVMLSQNMLSECF